MFFVTIDCVTNGSERKARSMLSSIDKSRSINEEPKYDDFSSVLSCISNFFHMVYNDSINDKIYIFPVSLVSLYNTEIYDIAVNLTKLMLKNISNVYHISLMVDGDENVALEDIINNRYKSLLSLEELKERRNMIRGILPIPYSISESVSTIHLESLQHAVRDVTDIVNRQNAI
jgi:hypothetical protein